MPITFTYDPALKLIYTRYSGVVGAGDIERSVAEMVSAFGGAGEVDAIHIFTTGVDLSALTIENLEQVKAGIAAYAASGIVRKKSALVNEGSSDAMILSPLWRALCKTDPTYPTEVGVFSNLESACAWIERDPTAVKRLGERTGAENSQG